MPRASDQLPNVPAPKKREWFKGTPDKPGTYWVQRRFYHGDVRPMVEVVHVYEGQLKGTLGVYCWNRSALRLHEIDEDMRNGMWFGPIKPETPPP